MSKDDSAQYFHSRDRVSQIASYASHQSEEIVDKAALLKKVEEVKAMFDGKPIPLPENWGGYLVEPYEFEFFVYGDNRINDRFLYELKNGKWEVRRLQP
jgi:pyridoxamine 5'-phosphate oxidase